MLLIAAAAAVSSLCAMAALLLIGLQRIERMAKSLALLAAGMLLTISCAHLLPEALHSAADSHSLGLTALITLLSLIILEMVLANGRNGHQHSLGSGAAGLLGGTLVHTACDGIMLAAAFAADINVGLALTAAIFAHELPQEMGDYALLLECGFNRKQAFAVNLTALVGMVGGALSSSLILSTISSLLPYALTIAAASFMYVALSDLLPKLRHTASRGQLLHRLGSLLSGVILALLLVHH